MEVTNKQNVMSYRLFTRNAVDKDVPRLTELERENFADLGTLTNFSTQISFPGSFLVLAHDFDSTLGYVQFTYNMRFITLVSVVVDARNRRQGVGTYLVKHVHERLSSSGFPTIMTVVQGANIAAQLMFKKIGYRAVSTLRHHEHRDQDNYLMEYSILE